MGDLGNPLSTGTPPSVHTGHAGYIKPFPNLDVTGLRVAAVTRNAKTSAKPGKIIYRSAAGGDFAGALTREWTQSPSDLIRAAALINISELM